MPSLFERLRETSPARFARKLSQLHAQLERLQVAVGRLEERVGASEPREFNSHELSVFSQWGEDGLIAYLISRVPIEDRSFVEFGVEDYREANTRYLLMTRNWRGLVIDGSPANVSAIKADDISWRFELTALCSFVTRDNINDLIGEAGFRGDLGLLSVDIDGNDYWVWQAIDVVKPRIVVAEYNSLWGAERKVTVPYDPEFVRSRKHYSNLYYGASLAALEHLGRAKGYSLVGGNTAGNNAFFVRDDVRGALPVVTARQAYRQARFREARDRAGNLTFAGFAQRLAEVALLPLHDVDSDTEVTVESLALR